jgi:hypothetical protein
VARDNHRIVKGVIVHAFDDGPHPRRAGRVKFNRELGATDRARRPDKSSVCQNANRRVITKQTPADDRRHRPVSHASGRPDRPDGCGQLSQSRKCFSVTMPSVHQRRRSPRRRGSRRRSRLPRRSGENSINDHPDLSRNASMSDWNRVAAAKSRKAYDRGAQSTVTVRQAP